MEEVCSDEERSACIAANMLPTRVGSVWKSFRYHIESLGTISDPIIKDFVKELLFVCAHRRIFPKLDAMRNKSQPNTRFSFRKQKIE